MQTGSELDRPLHIFRSMINYLKYVLSLILILAVADLHGQVKAGRVIGLNLSTMTLKSGDTNYDTQTLAGIRFGGSFEIPLIGNLSLQPSILFSAKGSEYITDTTEQFISPIFIEAPIMAGYSIGSKAIKFSFLAGLYFACGIGGNNLDSTGALRSISFGPDETNDMKRFDVGLNLGALLDIKGILITFHYGLGLSNLSPDAINGSEIKNKMIGVSFTAMFAGKK